MVMCVCACTCDVLDGDYCREGFNGGQCCINGSTKLR